MARRDVVLNRSEIDRPPRADLGEGLLLLVLVIIIIAVLAAGALNFVEKQMPWRVDIETKGNIFGVCYIQEEPTIIPVTGGGQAIKVATDLGEARTVVGDCRMNNNPFLILLHNKQGLEFSNVKNLTVKPNPRK
jgi:hypothetical protein